METATEHSPSRGHLDKDDTLDRMLIERIARDRDATAMESIYVRYRPRLVGFLRRLTQNSDLIDESYNDVMVKVWEKAHQYKGHAKVSSWIFSIAYRTCLRMVKKQQHREKFIELAGSEMLDQVETKPEDPSDESILINAAIDKLSAKQRLVVELCYYEGYSTEEIGHIVKCPVNTVKTRLHHARKKIYQSLNNGQLALQSGSKEF